MTNKCLIFLHFLSANSSAFHIQYTPKQPSTTGYKNKPENKTRKKISQKSRRGKIKSNKALAKYECARACGEEGGEESTKRRMQDVQHIAIQKVHTTAKSISIMTMMMYCTSGCVGVGAEERSGERGGRSYTEMKCQPRGKGVGQRGGGGGV